MTIFDYIVIGLAVVGLVVGLVKGFLKQLLGFAGLIAVVGGTFYLYKYPYTWLESFIESGLLRFLVALLATAVVIYIVWSLISKLLTKLIGKIKVLKLVDRVLGGVFGIAFVYCLTAIVIASLQIDHEIVVLLKDLLGDEFSNSWVVQNLYAANPIGDWVIGMLGIATTA